MILLWVRIVEDVFVEKIENELVLGSRKWLLRHEKVLKWLETGENEPLGLHEKMLLQWRLSTQGKYVRLIKKIGPDYGQQSYVKESLDSVL